ncbi:hypothetical protein [Synechococcus sp. UW179B]|uniref:hypothetical protein n=1 Tax=Synechococcus sp. UW179B TaxID=2575516 RepID=UPI0014834CEF|nr:hypothetical protein [Synechococcus sp. UW179B]
MDCSPIGCSWIQKGLRNFCSTAAVALRQGSCGVSSRPCNCCSKAAQACRPGWLPAWAALGNTRPALAVATVAPSSCSSARRVHRPSRVIATSPQHCVQCCALRWCCQLGVVLIALTMPTLKL